MPHFLSHLLISLHTICRSAIAAVLAQVVPAPRSPFSHRPTRVVTMPLSPRKSLGISTSILLADSLNANRFGCGGNRLMSMGSSLHQSIIIRRALTVFVHDGMHRHAERLAFTAPSLAALPSPSLKVRFPAPTLQALASVGQPTSPVGPMSSSSGVMIGESDPAVVLHSLFHMRRTAPV